MDFEKKRGSITSQRLPSMIKLKSERDDIIAGAETQQLKDEIVYLTKKYDSMKEEKYESDKKLTEINININYLNRNYPYIFN